mmetsp:Transcript_9961/g.11569  ORF Transcript_9961/g.11569 Transcript_9961/m.11569 type:complete len:913 (+) Transcript_9961:168-2906(+)|eukprot:CAMPEP_0197848836 /NCGR_PEP_ID=MMETSP1438-20131217/10192_1 /TAXON_ID=1461541 /ORGANISM="Pterosperma sp., Strain CCMP1384" /LENGTH=912 /DNA_ID=CAMNT_0043461265 /DNA_START=160 /DNA_END=2898 /DNA_ORIENTATION=+
MLTIQGISGLLLSLVVCFASLSSAEVLIHEVSDKGTDNACDGQDWVELLNLGDAAVSLTGYVLSDDKGPGDDSLTFGDGVSIAAGEFKLLCRNTDFKFGIGGDDEVKFFDTTGQLVSTSGPLGDDGAFGKTWAKFGDEWKYTYKPTPGAGNEAADEPLFIAPPPPSMSYLNDEGTEFFGVDGNGKSTEGFKHVVTLSISMTDEDWLYHQKNASHEMYRPAQRMIVDTKDGNMKILNNFRMRTRGQSTMFFPACFGTPAYPFLLDFDSEDPDQTLFGVRKAYLRNSFGDASGLNEWVAHRMLARSGLPYLRTRHVEVIINGVNLGLYVLMEAPDQEMVFARSFPDYNPSDYNLYKIKSLAFVRGLGCIDGFEEDALRLAEAQGPVDGKYLFERGTHRPKIKQRNWWECGDDFYAMIGRERIDAVRAYVSHDDNCADSLIETGLVDRELGSKKGDKIMKEYIRNITEGTLNLEAAGEQLDVSQYLKSAAFMAAVGHMDSPIGNQNNFLMARSGDGKGWKMVQYDHNGMFWKAGDGVCPCQANNWIDASVMNPTCGPVANNKIYMPIFANENTRGARQEEYLKYMSEIVAVMQDESFHQDFIDVAKAIQPYVDADQYRDATGKDLSGQYSKTGPPIKEGLGVQILPFLLARSASLAEQLQRLGSKAPFPETIVSECGSKMCPALVLESDVDAAKDKMPEQPECGFRNIGMGDIETAWGTCEQAGGHLAKLETAAEREEAAAYLKQYGKSYIDQCMKDEAWDGQSNYVWVALFKDTKGEAGTKNAWGWSIAEDSWIPFSAKDPNWNKGEPNNHNGIESCATIDHRTMKLFDFPCEAQVTIMCYIPCEGDEGEGSGEQGDSEATAPTSDDSPTAAPDTAAAPGPPPPEPKKSSSGPRGILQMAVAALTALATAMVTF